MEEAVEAVVAAGVKPFPTVDKCDASGLGAHSSVVADLDGTLLRSRSAFPYYALVAFETGGVPRLLLLLLLSPLAAALRFLLASESACARVLVFGAMAGARAPAVLIRGCAPGRVARLLSVRAEARRGHGHAQGLR